VDAIASLLPSATDATAEAALREGLESSTEIPAPADVPPQPAAEDEQVKIVGPLRISIPLFNIFLNEADELSRRLTTEIAEWAMELHRPVGEMAIALAHSLAGSSATVGFADLSHLARTLEHALMRTEAIGHGTPQEARLFVETAEEIRRLLHQFAAGFPEGAGARVAAAPRGP
jgi:chemosensory pili system protein ChpA (sensor histidine kinase/response regulator)